MKRHFTYLMLTAGLSAMFGSLSVSAQQNQVESANIPFAFQANDTTLAAGKYDVVRDLNSGIIQIRDAHTGHGIFIRTHPADESKNTQPRLLFTCSGDNCALSSVYLPDKLAYAVYQPRPELTRKIGLATSVRSINMTAR